MVEVPAVRSRTRGGPPIDPLLVSSIVFLCALAGVLAGMRLRKSLPESHVDAPSKDAVQLGMGMIATMTALILGLVTASAKDTFDALDGRVREAAADIIQLDRTLEGHGPEAVEIRRTLAAGVARRIDAVWPRDGEVVVPDNRATGVEFARLVDRMRALPCRDDAQRGARERAVEIGERVLETRWLLVAEAQGSVPTPFLVILVFWISLLFASFGLFAPRNATVVSVLVLCALSVAAAVFLILELDRPFEGLIRISPEPMRYASARIGE